MKTTREQLRIKTGKILKLYYRGIRPNEVIVDNSSPTIAKELGYTTGSVDQILMNHSKEKLQEIYNREVIFEEVKPSNNFKLPC